MVQQAEKQRLVVFQMSVSPKHKTKKSLFPYVTDVLEVSTF